MRPLAIALALLITLAAQAGPRSPSPDVGFCKPQTWLFGGWTAPPRIPLLADVNGDGYADFVYASAQDKSIDVALNGKGWKPLRGHRLVSNLPQEIAAICAGHFGGKTTDIAVLGKQGGLLKLLSTEAGRFPDVARLTDIKLPPGRVWLLAGRIDAGPLDDLVVVSASGRVQIIDAAGKPIRELALGAAVQDAALGDVEGDGKAALAVRSGSHVEVFRLGDHAERIARVDAPKAQEALALGDVDGDGKTDLLVDGTLFLAPDFKRTVVVAGWDKFTRPVVALMANVAGHAAPIPAGARPAEAGSQEPAASRQLPAADLIIQHEGADYFGSTEADCDLYVSYRKSDPDWDLDGLSNADEAKIGSDPLDRSTSHDGLMDGWKVHGFAGVDLPAMGCSPLHKDVLVMNLPYDNVPVDQMEKYMRDEVVPFFAALPYKNLDGTSGFAIHWITETPALPVKRNEGKSWGRIAGETFPRDRIGLYHWMLIGGMGGGGQSGELADAGSTGMRSWSHEFGHQLGLSHTGKWSTWSPTYTSLMNYSYSYGFEGDRKKVHFSTGELAGLILNESHLPGKVPFPIEKLKFLEGPPYRLHLKSAGPDATFVDWGWTGVFSDRTVRANITFGYSVGAGERLQPSGTKPFNYDGPYELMTDYQAALVEHQGTLYMATASRPPLDPKAPRPKTETLVLQSYIGRAPGSRVAHAWTAPATIAPEVTGDPSAVSDGRDLYIFYPTPTGVAYRFGSPDALGEPQPIPETEGALPTAVAWKGEVLLLLYRSADKPIVARTVHGDKLGPEMDLGIKSTIPPGAAVDTIARQLLLGTAAPQGRQQNRWQLCRLKWDEAAKTFKLVTAAFVGGDKNTWAGSRRPTLIFNAGREFGPHGRIYWIAAGMPQAGGAAPTFLAQTIGYKDVNDGWLLWRYYDEWTNTRSGIGAVWNTKDKDITIATTWASGSAGGDCGVFVAYNGSAIGHTDMADFDDISLMANYGMERSIGAFAAMPPERERQ